MTDMLNASPAVILIVLFLLSWFLNSRLLKILTFAFFFLYPVMAGTVNFDVSLSYVEEVLRFWSNQFFNELIEYVKSNLF